MNKLVMVACASALGLGVLSASPSNAQVRLGIGPDGPNVQVGPSREERWHERRRNDFERRRAYREDRITTGSVGCRTTVVRERNSYGDVVTREIRRCR